MFIDDVMKKYPEIPKPEAIFKIQNVADYYFEVEPNGIIDYEKNVFSYAIPFDKTWFEYRTTKTIREKNVVKKSPGILQFGVLATNLNHHLGIDSDTYNGISLDLYGYINDQLEWWGNTVFICDKQYKYMGRKLHNTPDRDLRPTNINQKIISLYNMLGDGILMCWFNPVLLTLNFLHCKNITQVENPLDPKLIKARQKRNKSYFEKYYTLEIEPMKKILDTEGEAQTKGFAHALHICRGHFKTYLDKGLFGKQKGTYWWPAHARGSAQVGTIKKDYEIKL